MDDDTQGSGFKSDEPKHVETSEMPWRRSLMIQDKMAAFLPLASQELSVRAQLREVCECVSNVNGCTNGLLGLRNQPNLFRLGLDQLHLLN